MRITKLSIIIIIVLGLAVISILSAQTRPRLSKQCKENFKKFDTNKDVKLSLEEFRASEHKRANAEANFKSRDADKDGFLSPEEFCSQTAKGQGRGRNR